MSGTSDSGIELSLIGNLQSVVDRNFGHVRLRDPADVMWLTVQQQTRSGRDRATASHR